jgi:hypothetical protein
MNCSGFPFLFFVNQSINCSGFTVSYDGKMHVKCISYREYSGISDHQVNDNVVCL